MDYGTIIFVLTGALVNVPSAQTRQYHFESTPLNWTEAQSFCRRVYTDLATIETISDVSAVLKTTPNYTGNAWIGLYNNNWKWSLSDSSFYGEGETEYRNWAPGHTGNPNGQECVGIGSNVWDNIDCNNVQPFVCYNGSVNGTSSFVKVDDLLTWVEAQRYCRENYVDLASIRNPAENDIISKLVDVYSLWIGLHWERLWSDGSTFPFQYWANGQPDSAEQCVTTAFNNSGLWSDDNCSLTFPFICYSKSPDYVLALNIKLESLTQLSDSELQRLLEEVRRYIWLPELSFKVLRREIRIKK